MSTYRTPDVYVEEISVFPPSVAEVETAIPAFIGYTALSPEKPTDDPMPRKVQSLLEFEQIYGKSPTYVIAETNIDEAGNFLSAAISNNYVLYDSLRLFYDNGGGDCYIVSAATYSADGDIDRDKLLAAVRAVAKVDEPTILLFPDAANLSAQNLATVQQAALKQCGELKDRVAVLDTRLDDAQGAQFRDNIGINNLKYGATYTPWLKINYSKVIDYYQIKGKVKKNGVDVDLKDLTGEPGILDALQALDDLDSDAATARSSIQTLTGANESLSLTFAKKLAAYKAIAEPTAANAAELFDYVYGIAKLVDGWGDATPLTNATLVDDITHTISSTLIPAYRELIALEKELAAAITAGGGSYTAAWDQTPPTIAVWGGLFAGADSTPDASSGNISGDSVKAMTDSALKGLQKAFSAASGVVDSTLTAIGNYQATYQQTLLDTFTPYRNIIKGISSTLTVCPPSGAIVGIYALVDNQRGVWKAPANVSLNGVIAPVTTFTLSETDALNIDATSGKSINAIRAFAGKGTLVWGARTLAGNDNEWRYISVRRFFNMVEESIKKSTYWAVFEPNDANTWIKVKGMIENYLTQKWREGALAGATTKDAFFVRCGLGVTMSAQDVLEGRMNVEVGMAVVRPAEFIVLKFSHKLQTS